MQHEELPKLRPQQKAIYDAYLQQDKAVSDAEMMELVGIPSNSFRPRRRELADMGLLERVGSERNPRGRQVSLWRAVPPGRIAEVRQLHAQRSPRRIPIEKLSFEKKLEAVRRLLNDDEVNKALQEQHGRSWSRVRGRARGAQSQREREIQADLAEAERQRDFIVDFLKVKRNLVKTVSVIHAIEDFVREDLERRNGAAPTRISPNHWPEVADLLADVAHACTSTEELVREELGLREDVIDVDEIEVEEIFELAEGDDEPRSQGPNG